MEYPPWFWMVLGGSGVAALLLWLFMKSLPTPDGVKRVPELFFTKLGPVNILNAENISGTLITPKDGGQKEDTSAVVIYRSGRLMFGSKRPPEARRRRRYMYVARQHDSGLLNLRGLFTGNKITREVTKKEIKPYKNFAARQAASDAVKKTSPRDMMTRMLSIAAVISVAVGGTSLILVQVISSMKG